MAKTQSCPQCEGTGITTPGKNYWPIGWGCVNCPVCGGEGTLVAAITRRLEGKMSAVEEFLDILKGSNRP